MERENDTTIPLIPECPDAVIRASENDELVIFIGAGVSRLIGCKGWNDLATDLVRACVFEGCISHRQTNKILEYDPKKIISICRSLLTEIGKLDTYYKAIRMSLRADEYLAEKFPVYSKLAELKALFVTTNMDDHFDKKFVEQQIYLPTRLNETVLNEHSLYHIHGSIKDPKSMVFTTEDYLLRYRDASYIRFLNELFTKRTVLFIGYGLSELEVLDYLFVKTQSERTHHLLLGLKSNQTEELEFERAYYRAFNIEVHPFQLDELGYHQLYKVIDSWCNELKLGSNLYVAGFNFIDQYIETFDDEHVSDVLQRLRTDEAFQDHFFKKVTALEWFEPLLDEGYFDPDKNQPIAPSQKEGYYTVPNWRALTYLVTISSAIKIPEHKNIGESIMDIIRRVSAAMDMEKFNSTTAWRFVEIMGRLPTELVLPQDFEFVKQYLSSPMTTNLIAGEVAQRLFTHFIKHGTPEQIVSLWRVVIGQKYKDPADEASAEVPNMDEYWLEQLINANLERLCTQCSREAWEVTFDLLKDITGKHQYSFDYLWIRNLNSLSFKHHYQDAILIAARALLIAVARKDPKSVKALLQGLLNESHPIFKRLAVVAVSELWDSRTVRQPFWSFLNLQVLCESELSAELADLVKRHYGSFSPQQKKLYVEWVTMGPTWAEGASEDDIDAWKLRWLQPIADFSTKALREYQEIHKRIMQRHPDWTEQPTKQAQSATLWQASDVLAMSVQQLVQALDSHEQEGGILPNAFYNDSLTSSVVAAFKQQPDKYLEDWAPLIKAPAPYFHTFVQGLHAGLKDNKIPLGKVTLFSIAIVAELAKLPNNPGTISLLQRLLPDMLNLVKDFMTPNSLKYTKRDLLAVKRLLRNIHELAQGSTELIQHSYTESCFIRAWLEYALRCDRQNDSKESVRWESDVRDMVTHFVHDGLSKDGWVMIGGYLPQIGWLDIRWLSEHLTKLFPDDQIETWTSTMDGYLYARVYEPIYTMLKSRGVYSQALGHSAESSWRQRLMHHIGAAYLSGWDSLESPGSLTKLCIDRWINDDLNHLVNFFWVVVSHQPFEELQQYRERVRTFWQEVHTHMSTSNYADPSRPEFCEQLTHLLFYFDEIDYDLQEWLLYCADRMEHTSGILIKELDRLCKKSPSPVGTIYLRITQRLLPDYDKADIQSIIEKLFMNGERNAATSICNTYFMHGMEFLRDVFDKYYGAE